MKKIYLVKKDPKAANSPENWIILNKNEFKQFLSTEEGKRRSGNFAKLNGVSSGDSIILVECDTDQARPLRSIYDHNRYELKKAKQSNISVVSLYAMPVGDEIMNGEELLIDEACDIEKNVISRIQIEEMLESLGMLSEEEKDLIEALYLKRTHTEKSYGLAHGMPQWAVHRQKIRILQKLRNLLE